MDTNKKRKRKRKRKKRINNDIIISSNNIETNQKVTNNIKKSPIISDVIISFIFLICIGILLFKNNIILNLNGSNNINLEVYSQYNDLGYNAKFYNINLNNQVNITSNLNTNKLGTYQIIYNIFNHKKIRYINVIDNIPPKITLKGKEKITIYQNENYIDEGVTVIDNYDHDLENKVIITNNVNINKVGTYNIKYKITDTSGNTSEITREVSVIKNPIDKYIKEKGYNTSIGYYNLTTGKSYYYNKNKLYYGASLIKVLDALYLYDNNLVTNNLKPYIKTALSYVIMILIII